MSSAMTLDFNIEARNKLIENAGAKRQDTDNLLRSLAAEIAMGINDFEVILANHGLSKEGWDRIKVNARFCAFLSEAAVEWGATSNAAARIKAKSEAMLETALPHLYKLLVTGDELTGAKVKLVEALMKGGGVGVDTSRNVADGVSITINMDAMPAARPTITIDHNADDM